MRCAKFFFLIIFHYIITIDHKQYYKKLPQSSFQHWIWILYPLIEAEIIKLLHSKLTIYGKWPLFCFFYFFKKLEIHPRGYLTYMENYLSFLIGFADYVIDKRNNSNSFFFSEFMQWVGMLKSQGIHVAVLTKKIESRREIYVETKFRVVDQLHDNDIDKRR